MGDEIRGEEMKTKMDARKYATEKKKIRKRCASDRATPTLARTLDDDEFDLNQFLQDRLLGTRRSTCGN